MSANAQPGWFSGRRVQRTGRCTLLSNSALRMAIRNNLVSFPAQIPPLMTRFEGDNHERMAHLYFVSGWSLRCLCERYRLNKAVVQNILANWRLRAMESGYIQEIQPEVLDEFARDEEPESPEMALVN